MVEQLVDVPKIVVELAETRPTPQVEGSSGEAGSFWPEQTT